MMTSSNKYPFPGEIWLAYLYFSDHPQKGKVRPVLILENDDSNSVSLVLKITTNDFAKSKIPVYEVKEWEEKGLRKPSYIRLDQKFLIQHNDLLSDRSLGIISIEEFRAICRILPELSD